MRLPGFDWDTSPKTRTWETATALVLILGTLAYVVGGLWGLW